MIKIGVRNNLLYPSLFILSVFLRRMIKFILEFEKLINYKAPFLLSLLMFFFEFILGGIMSYLHNTKKIFKKPNKILGIKLIVNNEEIKRKNSITTIFLLILVAAIVAFIGALTRRYIADYETTQITIRLRSFEILVSSILSYFLLNSKIERHHLFSLIIISICLLFGVIIEFVFIDAYKTVLIGLLILFVSTLTRAILDIIEKYLFDENFIDVFKLTSFEGFIDTVFCCIAYSFKEPRNEIKDLIYKKIPIIITAIIILILYGLLSFFKNIYRRHTLIEYSPMTRALAESILDPLLIIFYYLLDSFYNVSKNDKNKNKIIYHFIMILILSMIMVFCSLVYNDFFVLYFCDLEKETYVEVCKRSTSDNNLIDDASSDNEKELKKFKK